MSKLQAVLPLILVLAVTFSLAFADAAATLPVQEQVLQQVNSLLHAKPGISLELGKKQVTEYSLIGAIALVVIVAISASARSKRPKAGKKVKN